MEIKCLKILVINFLKHLKVTAAEDLSSFFQLGTFGFHCTILFSLTPARH